MNGFSQSARVFNRPSMQAIFEDVAPKELLEGGFFTNSRLSNPQCSNSSLGSIDEEDPLDIPDDIYDSSFQNSTSDDLFTDLSESFSRMKRPSVCMENVDTGDFQFLLQGDDCVQVVMVFIYAVTMLKYFLFNKGFERACQHING